MQIIVILVGYLLTLVVVGIVSRAQARRADRYVIAGHKAGTVRIAASLFCLLGGGELVTMASLSYSYSYGSFWFFGGISLGFILLAPIVARIRERRDLSRYVTLSDYFHDQYGAVAGRVVSITIVVAFGALLMVQFIAGGQLLASLMDWPYALTVGTMAAVILFYLTAGGFESVLNTDLLQGAAMLVLAAIVVPFLPWHGVDGIAFGNFASLPALDALSFLAVGSFVVLASGDVWQAIFAASTSRRAQVALFAAAGLFALYGIFLSELGIAARLSGTKIDADSAFYVAVRDVIPSWLIPLAIVITFAAITSTADTEVFLVSSTIVREAIRWRSRDVEMEAARDFTRLSIPLVTLAGMAASLLFTDLVPTYFSLIGIVVSLAPVIVASAFTSPPKTAVLCSLLAGLSTVAALIATRSLSPTSVGVVLPVAAVGLLVGWLPKVRASLERRRLFS